MNHAITLGGLLCAIGIIAGILAILFGALEFMAGGMSDAPSEGNAAAKQGCIVAAVGLVAVIGCLVGLFA